LFEDLLFIQRNNPKSSPITPVLEILQQTMFTMPPAGHISVARILLYPTDETFSFRYETQILYTAFRSGTVCSRKEFLSICKVISKKAGFKFCHGIDVNHYYSHYYPVIRYNVEKCHMWNHLFECIDSKNCLLWHELGKTAPYEDHDKSVILCKGCKHLHSNLDH